MATYLLTRSRPDFPPVFLARSRADLFRVISQALEAKRDKFKINVTRAGMISDLSDLKPSSWEPGLHFISLNGQEWMLIITEGECAFGVA